jgi:RNA polymerase sigma-70 factor (ECF subfamily)
MKENWRCQVLLSILMQISLVADRAVLGVRRSNSEIEALLRDARPWLYRLALAITGRSELAEDATQEALVRAAKSWQKLGSVQDPPAWLRTVVVRCAITSLQTAKPGPPIEAAQQQDPTVAVAVQLTLARMCPSDRALLALVHFEELSYAEIAQILEIPVGTVASRLHTAREAFRKEWLK